MARIIVLQTWCGWKGGKGVTTVTEHSVTVHRPSPKTFENIRIQLRPTRRLLYDFYADDYRLFGTQGACSLLRPE